MPTSTQRFRLVGEDDASRAFLQVAAASRLLKSNMDDVGSSVLGLGKLIGGTGLIPVVAGTTAAVTELTTALGAAAGAGGIFGLSVVGQVKSMILQRKAIATTEKSLSGLTKGTKTYHDTLVKLHLQQRSFQQDFGPAAKGLDDMQVSWHKFLDATKPVTNGVLMRGFYTIATTLPKLVPVSNAAGGAIRGLIDDFQAWTDSAQFNNLIHFLAKSGPRDITAFGHIVGNVFSGLGGILSNFIGPGDHAAKTLEHLTEKFDRWGHSKGVSKDVDRFLKYVGDNGPQITAAMEGIAEATPKIASSLGKLGSANLSVTSKFITLVAGLPQGAFNVVVDGLFAIAAGSKAITAVTGLKAILTGVAGVASGKGLTGKTGGGILGAGVQKVWVVNMGKDGLGGPGGPGGTAAEEARIARYMRYGAYAGGVGATAGVFYYGARGVQRGVGNIGDMGNSMAQSRVAPTLGGPGGGPNVRRLAPVPGGFVDASSMKSIRESIGRAGTALDSLRQGLGKASQGMDLVGHAANRAFPGATKQVIALSGKVAGISGGKAAAALDLVGHSAAKNFATASGDADQFKGKLNSIPSSKTVKVNADTGAAQGAISAVKAALASIDRVVNVHVNVTRFTNANLADVNTPTPTPHHHSRHPGGGSSGGAAGAGSGGGASMGGRGGASGGWLRLLDSMVGNGKMPLSHVLDVVRGRRSAGRSRLQATTSARNQFASGFQSFATSAFGADYGTNATTGAAIAPTFASILAHQQEQASQAAMVKTDVRKLVHLGLSPALLKQLQAAGAAGIPEIEALAGASRKQIRQYNQLNKQTSRDLRAAGMSAGNAIYGSRIRQEQRHNAAVEHLLKQLVDMAKNHPDKLVAVLKGDHIDLVLAGRRRTNGGKLQSDKTP